ncbi:rhomboid family intramembrane serine protease [Neptunicoccus cionae]|uniref:Rhomboid family intramembrane serine protease n=1 Tax=Neptunicoccus cionae TaxID=2035344 RepID=A0A916R2I4_9RHOB|nr:rhomboid family intramembrane serine protease [Amylibacter cionae]GGA28997.1 rhomboid family intramembrane serine protease [Amylibacter cionae]
MFNTPHAPRGALIAILAVIIASEVALQMADLGWIGSPRWRSLAYQYGAFWPGLLDSWAPNYAAQPVTMFVSYAFLHGGLGHLAGNALALWFLGQGVVTRIGQGGFLGVFALTALGGAVSFAALSAGNTPMVGASGALFGLIGIGVGWRFFDSTAAILRRARYALGSIALMVLLNILLNWWYNGHLAWQAHLGGFVTGLVLAKWLGARPRDFMAPQRELH